MEYKFLSLKFPPELVNLISAYARPRNDKMIVAFEYLFKCSINDQEIFSQFIFKNIAKTKGKHQHQVHLKLYRKIIILVSIILEIISRLLYRNKTFRLF